MKKLIFAALILMTYKASFGQGIDNTNKNIYGYNRIITGTSDWLDIQLSGAGSTFQIHDNTNGGNWVRWNAGSSHTEFLKNVVLSSGKLGIGTTNPYSVLEITPIATSWGEGIVVNPAPNNYGAIFFRETAGTYNNSWFLGKLSTDNFGILRQGLTGMTGTSRAESIFEINHNNGDATFGNKVGIGVSSPYVHSRLHIKASTAQPWGIVAESSTNDRIIGFGHDGSTGIISTSYFSSGGHSPLQLRTQNIARITIDVNGNTGMGTTSPISDLTLVQTNNGFTIAGANPTARLYESLESNIASSSGWELQDYSSSDDRFRIIRRDAATINEMFAISKTGNVGIGTTNPTKLLHISSGAPSLLMERTGSISWETRIDNNGRFIIQDASNATEPLKMEALTPTATIYTKSNGNVGIGTADPKSKLAVNGEIRATKVKVQADINSVPDYVFEDDYELRSLQETKDYIAANKHLPEIPSAEEIGKDGFDLGDMNMRLLKKIEELTLYQIQLMEEMGKVKKELQELKSTEAK